MTVRAPSPGIGSTVGGCFVHTTKPRSNSEITGVHSYPRRSDSPRAQPAAISSASSRVIIRPPVDATWLRAETTGPRRVAPPGSVTTIDGSLCWGRTTMADMADRDANHALRARLDDVYGQSPRLRSGRDDMQRQLPELRVTAESDDGLIRATVGPRGELLDLRLDHRIYRDMDADALAR